MGGGGPEGLGKGGGVVAEGDVSDWWDWADYFGGTEGRRV